MKLSNNTLFQSEIQQWSKDIKNIKDTELQNYLAILLEQIKRFVYEIDQSHQDLVNGQNSFNLKADIRQSLYATRQKIKKHILEARKANLL